VEQAAKLGSVENRAPKEAGGREKMRSNSAVFDPKAVLTKIESGKTTRAYRSKTVVFSQGERATHRCPSGLKSARLSSSASCSLDRGKGWRQERTEPVNDIETARSTYLLCGCLRDIVAFSLIDISN
jgi:hypothetical protein